ncbi:MAG: 50S ribosomal protein L25 [Planctomycetes bacterium]|nr:50S ribosomal protein L25 [Planctomycetota bacterium]
MTEQLKVETRTTTGKRHAKRQRAEGRVPAVLYGHGQEVVGLSVEASALGAAIRHGARLVELSGALTESALVRAVQWDTFGTEVLHVDFTRVSADERIEVTISVDLNGTAPGIKQGGVVQHLVHEVEIECPAGAIPEKLLLSVNHLELGQSILASAIELPAGAKLISAEDAVVVQCELPQEEDEQDAGAAGAAEPELIGRKAEDGEEEKEE